LFESIRTRTLRVVVIKVSLNRNSRKQINFLYRRLRRLRIGGIAKENTTSSKDIAKVALMLEQAVPGLEVSDVDYDGAMVELGREHLLASRPRVVEDARGNLHAADDNGHLYSVGGKFERLEVVNFCLDNISKLCVQRPCVDKLDKPTFMSLIRRDVPKMPLMDLIQLDKLSRNKLKHLLIGSPSSVHWSEDIGRSMVIC
jgi:hypothetical protein